MRRIKLIERPSARFDKDTQPEQWEADRFDYRDALQRIIAVPFNPQIGATLDEVRRGAPILQRLENLGLDQTLDLNEDEYKYLVLKIYNFRWAKVDHRFLEFVEVIENAALTTS